MNIKDILSQYKNVAVVGMSANESKPSHWVPMFLKSRDFEIIPVNPAAAEIAGMKSYPAIMDVDARIDILNVFRPSEACLPIIKEALERRKHKGDISVIWLQEGITCDEGKALAESEGVVFVQDMCMYKEYNRFMS